MFAWGASGECPFVKRGGLHVLLHVLSCFFVGSLVNLALAGLTICSGCSPRKHVAFPSRRSISFPMLKSDLWIPSTLSASRERRYARFA